jgi:hypothetical protein
MNFRKTLEYFSCFQALTKSYSNHDKCEISANKIQKINTHIKVNWFSMKMSV